MHEIRVAIEDQVDAVPEHLLMPLILSCVAVTAPILKILSQFDRKNKHEPGYRRK